MSDECRPGGLEGRRSKYVIWVDMRQDDVADWLGCDRAHRREQFLADRDTAAGVDDRDGVIADDEPGIGDVATIFRAGYSHEALVRVDARRQLAHERLLRVRSSHLDRQSQRHYRE